MAVQSTQFQFLDTVAKAGALQFGEFKLKSERISPYFFKADKFDNGNLLSAIGRYYASTINVNNIPGDIVFGPAYKGIPLATAAAIGLAESGRPVQFSADRKEVKTHGDGGDFIGVKPDKKIILIDDVITSGKSLNEACDFVHKYEGEVTGAVVMVDRQERGKDSDLSAVQEVEKNHGIKVYSIANLEDILEYTKANSKYYEFVEKIEIYRETYGVK